MIGINNTLELSEDFFDNFLNNIENLFTSKNMSIVECKRNSDNEIFYALAATKINPLTKSLDFTPICFFWNKNPKMEMKITSQPLVSSQKTLTEWIQEADMTVVNVRNLN